MSGLPQQKPSEGAGGRGAFLLEAPILNLSIFNLLAVTVVDALLTSILVLAKNGPCCPTNRDAHSSQEGGVEVKTTASIKLNISRFAWSPRKVGACIQRPCLP
jgi:hypothetical protein